MTIRRNDLDAGRIDLSVNRAQFEAATAALTARTLQAVRATLHEAHSLDRLAAQALMSRRNFTRHFRQLTGQTFGEWLLAERLKRCQQLLEASALGMDEVAHAAGFGSTASLRLHFKQAFGVAPSQWRQNFKGQLG